MAFADNWFVPLEGDNTFKLSFISLFTRFAMPSDMVDVYREDYIDLYVNYIGKIFVKEDFSRPYVTSSPSNGLKTMIDGWLSLKPQDEKYGDSELSFLSILLTNLLQISILL